MKQRGSALIISMMLIATVGAAAFGIARLLYADTSIATTYENGTVAYYAAESGIEEGFLRYKYSMNAEVPYANWALNDNMVFRTNLATNDTVDSGTAGAGIADISSVSDPSKQFYDLRMGYLGTYYSTLKIYEPFFAHDTNDDGTTNATDIFDAGYSAGEYYSSLRIPKDEARTFDLSNVDLSANKLDLGLKFIGVGTGGYTPVRECQAMAEVKFLITNTNTGVVREYKALTNYNPDTCENVPLFGISASKLDRADAGLFATGGYKNAGGSTYAAGNTDYYYSLSNILNTVLNKAGALLGTNTVSMTIKPLYYPADISFTTEACKSSSAACLSTPSAIVTGPYTYINSTGYYGGTSRTLTANIDRQSGTLYDLYNYVLFKGN